MAKARVGFYTTKGDTLGRSHKSCPKCGPGIFLAEHANRRSCGRCGYSESKSAAPATPPVAAPVAKAPKAPRAPKAAAPPAAPAPAK